jgi:hypothetical protein
LKVVIVVFVQCWFAYYGVIYEVDRRFVIRFDVPFTPNLDVDVVGCVDGYGFSIICIGVSVDVDVSYCDYKWFLLVSVLGWVKDDESCFGACLLVVWFGWKYDLRVVRMGGLNDASEYMTMGRC